MKRLLAYSSIENIGIIVAASGSQSVRAYDKRLLAATRAHAVLYHAINHAFFKSLLFLGTGSVLHATRSAELGKLGGLIHRMPWVAWLALVGTLACRGSLRSTASSRNGCCCRRFLFTPTLPQSFVNMLVPWPRRAVLSAALAAYVMVKFFGVVFLGRRAKPDLAHAQAQGRSRRSRVVYSRGCVSDSACSGARDPR
jgi:formate hydrogenlyase subunit 3/multisubunit Na+/H+ antiporter MnhD subunit